jgi:3-hydroxyacyl-[acyl-carrier-protein] dehydratase
MAVENNNLFKLTKKEFTPGMVTATFEINRQSDILKGHFPGHPVVPGASMLHLIKQVLEDVLARPLIMKQGDNLKFIALVDPEHISSVDLEVTYQELHGGTINVEAKLTTADVLNFKFQGVFVG